MSGTERICTECKGPMQPEDEYVCHYCDLEIAEMVELAWLEDGIEP